MRERLLPLPGLREKAHEAHVPLRIARRAQERRFEIKDLLFGIADIEHIAIDFRPVDPPEERARHHRRQAQIDGAPEDAARHEALRFTLAAEMGEDRLRPLLGVDLLLNELEERRLIAP